MSSKPTAAKSSRLRDQLFAAIHRKDDALLSRLCTRHAESIVACFADWCELPAEVAHQAGAIRQWQNDLELIATLFASAGIPELQRHLEGSAEEQALLGPSAHFLEARQLSEAGRHEDSIRMIADILNELPAEATPMLEEFLAHTYGQLGNNFYLLHDPASAQRYAQLARDLCEHLGDQDGVRVHTENLAAIRRLDPACTIARCRSAIGQAQEHTDRMRYDASNGILRQVSEGIAQHRELERYRPKVLGLMGFNHFWLGDLESARTLTEEALQGCLALSDEPGQKIYRESLRVIAEAVGRSDRPSKT